MYVNLHTLDILAGSVYQLSVSVEVLHIGQNSCFLGGDKHLCMCSCEVLLLIIPSEIW